MYSKRKTLSKIDRMFNFYVNYQILTFTWYHDYILRNISITIFKNDFFFLFFITNNYVFFLSRVCLLPKALAIAQLYNVNTCIVVDSGATCTSVSVVINGKVDMTRCQNINVGGWHVSQFLKQALDWKNQKDNALVI